MYKVVNILENRIVFEGDSDYFREFAIKVRNENNDSHLIMGVVQAIYYINNFCENLKLTC